MILLLLACAGSEPTDSRDTDPADTDPADTDTADPGDSDTGAPDDTTIPDTGDPGPIEALALSATPHPDRVTEVALHAELSRAARARWSCTADDDEHHLVDLPAAVESDATLYGLLPETLYRCALVIEGKGELGAVAVTTGAFADLPDMEAAGDLARMTGAYTLFNAGPVCDIATDQQVWIVDPDGRPRWLYTIPENATADIDATWLGEGELLIGGGRGVPTRGQGYVRRLTLGHEVRWERDDPVTGFDYNHQAEPLATGEVLSIVWQVNVGPEGAFYGFGIERLDPATGVASFDWDSQRAVDAGTLTAGGPGTDWFHANSAKDFPEDPEGPAYWVSLAQQSQVIRVDATTGEVSWKLGKGGDFVLLDAAGDPLPEEQWFEFQHSLTVDVVQGGVLLRLHDNGYTRGASRALDLLVDVDARTAQVVWEWTEPEWVERNGGDYDVLDSGNRLLTQGHCWCCDESGDRESTITEVDPEDGAVVWRLTVHGDDEWLYRAQRIDGCAIFANAKYCPEWAE